VLEDGKNMNTLNKQRNPAKSGDWTTNFVHYWKYYSPPARASPSDLRFIEAKIKGRIAKCGNDNIKVLVLGATPEYRNLCGELGVHCYCFDFSKYNYEYLTAEIKSDFKPKLKEVFIEGNWVEKVLDDKFDIILGDNVLNLVFGEDLSKMLNNIRNMLKKEGIFMPRSYIMDKDERLTAEEAVKQYREEGSKKPIYSWLGRDLYLPTQLLDMKKGFFMLKDMWLLIIGLHNKGLLTNNELEEFSKLSYENREFRFFLPVLEDFENLLNEFFIIKETFYGTEPYLKNKFPLHVLMRK
jgi:hypothetical protein